MCVRRTKKPTNYSLIRGQRRHHMRSLIGRGWWGATKNKKRKGIAAAIAFTAAAGAIAYVLIQITGSGSVSGSLGTSSANVSLSGSFNQISSPGPVPAAGTCTATNCADLEINVTNPNNFPVTLKSLTVLPSGFSSSNSTCTAGITAHASDTNPWFWVGWKANSTNGGQNDARDTGDTYSFDKTVTIPANSTNVPLNGGSVDAFSGISPNVIWYDDPNNDQSSCQGSTITAQITATGTAQG